MVSAGFRRTILLLLLIAPALSTADVFDPLPTYDQGPLAQIYGLPTPAGARLLSSGKTQVSLTFEASSHFIADQKGTEFLLLDGETHRTAVTIKHGTARAEWGVEIPYLTHSGGFLDGFIDNWHDFFGLPDGGRAQAEVDRINYVYRRSGTELLRVTRATRGVGDVRLLAGWPLALAWSHNAALRASLKLPTGDAGQLHGSGAADLALWVDVAPTSDPIRGAFGWNATAGELILGRGDVLPDQQRRLGAFGGGGLSWRAGMPVVLKAELRAHTSFYRSTDLAPLARDTIQLILGGTWRVYKETTIDIAVSEDIRVHSAPDVSLLLRIGSRF